MAASPGLLVCEMRAMDGSPENDETLHVFQEEVQAPLSEDRIAAYQDELHQGKSEKDNMAELDDCDGDESCSSANPPRRQLDKFEDEAVECATPEPDLLPSPSTPTVVSSSDKEERSGSTAPTESTSPSNDCLVDHSPRSLPRFRDSNTCMWTASHAANSPSEDRSSSLVNVLLKPLNVTSCDGSSQNSFIRLSLWSVIDGHGGGCVATYASEVLLPHIAASVSRVLDCEIVDRGECRVNGELRDANALDLDGLMRSLEKSQSNPNSIHYRSPREPDEQEEADDSMLTSIMEEDSFESRISVASYDIAETAPSVKTSVKATTSEVMQDGPTGTHSPCEVARISHAITDSFLAIDEGWINSIDVLSNQPGCQTNGPWNVGACALVVFTVQRLDWTSNRAVDGDRGGESAGGGQDASHNHKSARLRMLDCADKGKSASSLSTLSPTSSLMTTPDCALSTFESEITETEDDEENERSGVAESHGQNRPRHSSCSEEDLVISTPGGCGCHFYRGNDAMLYTAHVGDCRAVLLGGNCPRTIKVPEVKRGAIKHTNKTDDSSYHGSDETAYMSSSGHSGHETGSSDEDDKVSFHDKSGSTKAPPHLLYMRRPARRQGLRMAQVPEHYKPFVTLPQRTNKEVSCSSDESDNAFDSPRSRKASRSSYDSIAPRNSSESFDDYQNRQTPPPPLFLSPHMRPIELTTDHTVYNPVEAAAVQRRCNNAAGAISSGLAGGIKRVAGSLAVTRALGDAYLKTPLLSFYPFKRHAPYITARPEVNCRLLPREEDPKTNNVLILATDGVWEQASGEDVLRWVRNYYAECTDTEKISRMSKDSSTDEVMSEGKDGDNDSPVKELKGFSPGSKKRKLRTMAQRRSPKVSMSTAADVIVRRVLNKVRRSRNMSSLHALISLPKGRARRSKHDDITTCVVDLAAFVA